MSVKPGGLRVTLVLIGLLFVGSTLLFAEDVKRDSDEEFEKLIELVPHYHITIRNSKEALDSPTEAGDEEELESESESDFQLAEEPVLRWSNPLRATRDGCVMLWTHEGRPATVMCAYWHKGNQYDHEFQSLFEGPFEVSLHGETKWTPATPGIRYIPVKDAKPALRSRAARLVQMRSLASKYEGVAGHVNKPRHPLRLLREPLYRYPKELEHETVVDGAIFALVMTTDPEVFVILEARRETDSDQVQWFVGFARMSVVAQFVKQKDQVVWKVLWGKHDRPEGTYFAWHHESSDLGPEEN